MNGNSATSKPGLPSEPTEIQISSEIKNKVEIIKNNIMDSKIELENQQAIVNSKKLQRVRIVKECCALKQVLVYEETQKNTLKTNIAQTNEMLDVLRTRSCQLNSTIQESESNIATLKQTYREQKQSMNEVLSKLRDKEIAIDKDCEDVTNEIEILPQKRKEFVQNNELIDATHKVISLKQRLHIVKEQKNLRSKINVNSTKELPGKNERHAVLETHLANKQTEELDLQEKLAYKKLQFQEKQKLYASTINDNQTKIDQEKQAIENLMQEVENKATLKNDLIAQIKNENLLASKIKLENDQHLSRLNKIKNIVAQNSNQFNLNETSKSDNVSSMQLKINEENAILAKLDQDIATMLQTHKEILNNTKRKEATLENLKQTMENLSKNAIDDEQKETLLSFERESTKHELEDLKLQIEANQTKITECIQAQREKQDVFNQSHAEKKQNLISINLEYKSLETNFTNRKNQDVAIYDANEEQIEHENTVTVKKIDAVRIEVGSLEEELKDIKIEVSKLEGEERKKILQQLNFRKSHLHSRKCSDSDESDTSTEGVAFKLRKRRKLLQQQGKQNPK